jgi:hypothetical protein
LWISTQRQAWCQKCPLAGSSRPAPTDLLFPGKDCQPHRGCSNVPNAIAAHTNAGVRLRDCLAGIPTIDTPAIAEFTGQRWCLDVADKWRPAETKGVASRMTPALSCFTPPTPPPRSHPVECRGARPGWCSRGAFEPTQIGTGTTQPAYPTWALLKAAPLVSFC